MKLLLTSAGVKNTSIRDALAGLLGKCVGRVRLRAETMPIAEGDRCTEGRRPKIRRSARQPRAH